MDKSKFWVWIGLTVALAAAVGALFWHQQGDEAEVEAVPPRMILPGHPLYVGWLAFFPDGKTLLSAGYDNAIRFWDVDTGKLLNTASIPDFGQAVLSPNGQLIAVGGPLKEVFLWNVSTGESTILAESRRSDPIFGFSPNSRTIAMAAPNPDPSVSIWDVETGALIQTVEGMWPMYSLDSKHLITTGKTARVWDIDTGALVHTLGGRSDMYFYIAYSPDGKRILTNSFESDINIWDADTGALIQTLQAHYGDQIMMNPAYHPDGKTISSVSENHVTIWDADTGALIQTLKKTGNDWWWYLPPDGKNLVQRGPNTLAIWDAATGDLLHTLSPSSDEIHLRTQSPDGKTIAGVNHNNGEIYIWRIE